MKKILYLFVCLSLFFMAGCSEEGRIDQVDDSAPAPAQVTITGNISKPGGAVIRYKVPEDKKLAAVKAVYERNGEICETTASIYIDSLTIEGFGDVNPREVKIFSIGRNNKLSEPVTETITPLTPPIAIVKFDMEPSYGAIRVKFSDNEARASLALVLLIDSVNTNMDAKAEWMPLHTFYTAAEKTTLLRTEMQSKDLKIAIYARDRWNNCSDTLVKIIHPYFLEKLPKATWTNPQLPGDSFGETEFLWDDLEYPTWYPPGCYTTDFNSPMPQHVTIQLGYKAIVSRMQIWPREKQEIYSEYAPRTFELWGSDNPPADGSYTNWHLLGKYEVYKPSGYNADGTPGVITADDLTHWYNGQLYEVEETEEVTNPRMIVTHVRFRTTSTYFTYGTSLKKAAVMFSEITLHGEVIRE